MADKQTAGRDRLGAIAPQFAALNDDVLFGEFFADMTGETLDEAQKKELFDVLEELLREEREAKI